MESGYGLLFARRCAAFDCSDPLTPRSQAGIWRILLPAQFRDAESGLHFARSERAHQGSVSQSQHRNPNSPDAVASVFVYHGLARIGCSVCGLRYRVNFFPWQ